MVACEFGCSREMKEQADKDEGAGAGRHSRADAEARGRSRYLVDDEGCLTFSGASGTTEIDSACMQVWATCRMHSLHLTRFKCQHAFGTIRP